MQLIVQAEGSEPWALPRGGADLVAFMSFAVARGFGAQHPYLALADRLHDLGVPLGPLTMFYGADAEDAEDHEKADLAWQDPVPLLATLAGMERALGDDEPARTFLKRAGAAGLEAAVADLAEVVRAAAGAGVRVRLLYRD